MTQPEIKDMIESESIHAVENCFAKGKFTYPESYCQLYETGAEFVYNLLNEELQKKDIEIRDLKMCEEMCVEEIKEQKKEIEKLKQAYNELLNIDNLNQWK